MKRNFVIMLFFLDIDGVMVPAKGWKSPELLSDGFPAFSSRAITALRNSISDEDTIMLTSSHKSRFSFEEWKDIFKSRGISIKKIQTLPENIHHLSRKDEIVNWFYANDWNENFVIIDDDKSLNELPGFIKENLVQTSPYIGLTEDHVEVIQSILNKGVQPA